MKTYSLKETAQILKYNEEYLRQKIRKQEIKGFFKVRGKWLIKETDLLKMMEV